MAESVTVEHGGLSVTTNTGVTEAELRTELETPPGTETDGRTDQTSGVPSSPVETPAAGVPRDDKGRFVPKTSESLPNPSASAAPPAPPAEAAAEPERQGRRRDDTLPKHNPVTRMQQALAAKAEAERRAVLLEAELARLRQPPSAPSAPSAPPSDEPQFETFADQPDPYTAYLQAWTRWDHKQQILAERAQWQAEQTAKARVDTFQARISTDKAHYPDFDQVLTQADTLGLQVSAVMQEAIAESPQAADLVYYLATHPEECTQLAEESIQTPVAAATVMRRLLESRLAPRPVPVTGTGTGARAPVSTAKPPVTPVGSSPVMSDDPPGDTASLAEHARYWNRRLRVPGTS